MGCTQRKLESPLTEEELLLQDYEDNFGLDDVSSTSMYEAIRAASIERTPLQEILSGLSNLGWTVDLFGKTTLVEEFLRKHCGSENDLISGKKAILFFLLLGKDSLENKAKILFDVCDLDVSESVSKEELDEVLTSLVEIALEEIPSFIESTVGEKDKRQLSKLRSKVTTMMKTIVLHMTETFLMDEEEIDKPTFIVVVQQTKAKFLTSSVGLRNFAFKSYCTFKRYEQMSLALQQRLCPGDDIRRVVNIMTEVCEEQQVKP
jgi:hypothetical protein